jgi:hypothetical protein
MSGYPLQGMAARKLLRHGFEVIEEWGYADRDTQEPRSLDIAAHLALVDRVESVKPHLSLLVECNAVDAVHIDFLDEFIDKHLLPFAHEFADRAIRLGDVFQSGGQVPSLDNWKWIEIEKWADAPPLR